MFTLTQIESFITWTLGGEDAPAQYPGVLIANEAGELLCSAREWNFLNRPPISRNLQAGQAWIDLPPDCRDVLDVQFNETTVGEMLRSTPSELNDLRRSPVPTPTWAFFWAVENDSGVGQGPSTVRLGLHKAPGTSLANALNLVYRAGWTPLAQPDDAANIPVWIEPLYREFIMAVARGRTMEDVAPTSDRLDAIVLGSMYAMAVRRDISTQANLGRVRGGLIQGLQSGRVLPYNPDATVGPPVTFYGTSPP